MVCEKIPIEKRSVQIEGKAFVLVEEFLCCVRRLSTYRHCSSATIWLWNTVLKFLLFPNLVFVNSPALLNYYFLTRACLDPLNLGTLEFGVAPSCYDCTGNWIHIGDLGWMHLLMAWMCQSACAIVHDLSLLDLVIKAKLVYSPHARTSMRKSMYSLKPWQ